MSRDPREVIGTIKTMLETCLAKSTLGSAALTENLAPVNDKYADDLVVYEAVITPQRLDQARLELWVTEDGNLAVGIEKRSRVAERIRVRTGSPHQFIGGHEPMALPMNLLEQLVGAIANGYLRIRARHIFGRLVDALAEVGPLQAAAPAFQQYARSLRAGFDLPIGRGVSLLYQPW